MRHQVPSGVLQPARRRRRKRRRWPYAVVLVALAAGFVTAWRTGTGPGNRAVAAGARAAAPAPARPPAARPASPKPVRLLSARPGWQRRDPLLAPTARAAVLVDAASGTVLWAKRPHERLPIASTTKIMTAVLALDRLGLTGVVTVPFAATRAYPNREGLAAGEQVRSWKLLYGLLLYSGNDDALALAIASAGSRGAFVAAMNREARELGLADSHFSTPSGVVDDGNYSTAWDLAALTRYAIRDRRFDTIVRTRVKHVPWAPPTFAKTFVNHNTLLGSYRGADGVKTGWTTKAGHCLVASATRDGLRLVAVVLKSRNAPADARSLLDYGFRVRG